MIDKLEVIQNDKVLASYSFTQMGVIVNCVKTKKVRIFGGWEGIKDLYNSFWNSFSEETTYEDAVKFFTTNIGQIIISG